MGGVAYTNGQPVDLADPTTKMITTTPPEGEQGSAYGGSELLFSRWDSGRVFSIDPVTEQNFEEMLRLDGKARTLEQVLTLPLIGDEWFLEPAKGDSGEKEWVEAELTRPANAGGMTTPFELVIAQMTSAVIFRRAYFEKVFKAEGGKVTYHKLAYRPARSCWLLRDEANYSFQGFKQKFMRRGEFVEEVIKPIKALVYIHGQHRAPLVGTSDLETAWSVFTSKQKVRFLWYAFLENQTIPKAIAKHDNSDDGEIQAFAKKVATLKGGGVLGIKPDQSVDAFEPSNAASETFNQAMSYLDAEMAGSVLAGFTNLPSPDAKGSYALSKDQSDFFLRSRQATLDEMASTITSWVVADLVRWNFGQGAPAPTFKFKPLAKEAVNESLETFKALATRPPDSRIPNAFMDELTEKVAAHLGLSTDKVAKELAGREGQTPTERLTTGIQAAARLVEQAGVRTEPQTVEQGDGSQPAPAA